MLWLLAVLLFLGALFGPEVYRHLLARGVATRGADRDAVALTFDDGPDLRYTPAILTALQEADARATFFLVGKRAAAHPDLVRQMVAAGHEIGVHGLRHRHSWFLGPVATRREIQATREILVDIVGRTPRLYRPPWGAFNLWTFRAARAEGLQTILWSAHAADWLGPEPEEIASRILRQASPGLIALLHDAGGRPGAPTKTARALPTILDGLARRGLKAVTVSELLTRPRPGIVLRLWERWEAYFARTAGLRPVGDPAGLVQIATVQYRGPQVAEGGQVLLRRGDRAIELHFTSRVLAAAGPLKARHLLAEALPFLAEQLRVDPELAGIGVIYGTTLFHRGAERFGFRILPLPSGWRTNLLGAYLRFLLGLYHPEGFERLRSRREALTPRLVAMARQELLRRYDRRENG